MADEKKADEKKAAEGALADGIAERRARSRAAAAEAAKKPRPKPKVDGTKVLRAGYRLPDGFVLPSDREVEFAKRGDKKVIVGPADLRPPLLLGSTIKE